MTPIEASLYLRHIPQIGAIRAQQLLSHYGSPQAVLGADPKVLLQEKLLTPSTYSHFMDWEKHKDQVAEDLTCIKDNNWECLLWGTDTYPKLLQSCPDAPILLFSKGKWDRFSQRIVSIVGTRKPTPYGKRCCDLLIEALAPYDPLIVSGFAYGIDIYAQLKALDAGLDTLGCLAHGFNRIYPAKHQKYVPEILQNGGFITEFLPTDSFDRTNFLRRNRIIAGLAHTTIVVESGDQGGSMITAGFASQYNREVFALPGPVDADKSQGCLKLIMNHTAQMIGAPHKLPELLGWSVQSQIKKKPLIQQLTFDQQQVYDWVAAHPQISLDNLARELQRPISEMAAVLMELELLGCIQQLPGKQYQII